MPAPPVLWGRVTAPSNKGTGLRNAAVLLASARFAGRNQTRQLLALLAQLAALSDAVTRLRETQNRAIQVAAARGAAEQLRHASEQRADRAAMAPAVTETRHAGTHGAARGVLPGPEQPTTYSPVGKASAAPAACETESPR